MMVRALEDIGLRVIRYHHRFHWSDAMLDAEQISIYRSIF